MRFAFYYGLAAVLAITLALLNRQQTPANSSSFNKGQQIPAKVIAADLSGFDDVWLDVMRPLALVSADVEARLVSKIRTLPEQNNEPAYFAHMNDAQMSDAHDVSKLDDRVLVPPPKAKMSHVKRDICRGKGRRWYNHHRSWRCRR